MLLAAMADDIIRECGKFGLDIRKKTAGGEMSPSMEGSSMPRQDQDAQVSSLGGNSPVVRGRLDQRPPATPSTHMLLWVQALVPSVPAGVL